MQLPAASNFPTASGFRWRTNLKKRGVFVNIPIPCKLGDTVITKKGVKTLNGVTWFQWNDGMEYTYFYEEEKKNKWGTSYFETQKNKNIFG